MIVLHYRDGNRRIVPSLDRANYYCVLAGRTENPVMRVCRA